MDTDFVIIDESALWPKWEYGIHHVPNGVNCDELLEDLNSLGSTGWDICGSFGGVAGVVAVLLLKRPLRENKEDHGASPV